jgi:hypothetical protein
MANVKKSKKASIVGTNKKKFSFNTSIIAVVLFLAFLAILYYVDMSMQNNFDTGSNPPPVISGDGSNTTTVLSACKQDSECFITHCKGQANACVNTTQLTDYSRNCDKYIDWVIDAKNATQCACVQNNCKML